MLLTTFIIPLIISSIGFKRCMYFISLGYSLSIAVIGLYLLIITNINLALNELFIGLLYIIYGLRLFYFLYNRMFKSQSYNKKMRDEISKSDSINLTVKFFIWISCAFLYCTQSSPLTFRILSANKNNDKLTYIGIIIMICGLILEIWADRQKDKSKKINPNRFVDTGLYRIVRCPNYLGETIFWTGNFFGGIGIYDGIFQWFFSLLGYVIIVYVMFSGARRLEIRQNKDYGNDISYKKYTKTIPILIPFIPLYSLEKYTWLKG